MRGIATGQRINALLVPEVDELIKRELRDVPMDEEGKRMSEEEKGLRMLVSWLTLNSLGSECKQQFSLMQQDLNNLHRRASMQKLLKICLDAKFQFDHNRDAVERYLASFREHLNVDVPGQMAPVRSFEDAIQELVEKHTERIPPSSMPQLERIRQKVAAVRSAQSEAGLEQEQEQVATQGLKLRTGGCGTPHSLCSRFQCVGLLCGQEQEEEKEQEAVEPNYHQPVITSDLAFARTHEQPIPWRVSSLQQEPDDDAGGGDDASKTTSTNPFYAARDFAIYKGQTLRLPAALHISRNWYNPSWEGPRRLKNAIILLEWMPSLRGLAEEAEPIADVPALQEDVSRLAHWAWRMFCARDGRLDRCALRALLECVLHMSISADELADGVSSEEALRELLSGSSLRTKFKGRHFAIITLREAETLRVILHARRRSSGGHSDAASTGEFIVGLRSVGGGGALLDASDDFPHIDDQQLHTCCQVLRFIDNRTHFSDAHCLLLLRALQPNDSLERQRFYRQLQIGHRRETYQLEGTPLHMALEYSNEATLMSQAALRLFLQLLLQAESMEVKELFRKFAMASDAVVTLAELCAALRVLQLPDAPEDGWAWLRAMRVEKRGEIPLGSFEAFVRERLEHIETRWLPSVGLSEMQRLEAQRKAAQAERAEEIADFLDQTLADQRQAHHEQEAALDAEQEELIELYQAEEELARGANPLIQDGRVCFDFSRVNLPSTIEFHGIPDLVAESHKQYVGKQFLRLHPHAVFYIRPIRLDPAPVIPEEEYRSEDSQGEHSMRKLQRKASSRSAIATTLLEPRLAPRATLSRYSIFFFIKCSGRPAMSLPLVTILQSEESDAKPGAICIETSCHLGDNLSDEESREKVDPDFKIVPGSWELITVVVDLNYGKMELYLNGELMVTVANPTVLRRGGGFELSPHLGLRLFAPCEMYGVELAVRSIEILGTCLSDREVREQHGMHGTWLCSECQQTVGPDRAFCQLCGTDKVKSAESPNEIPHKTTGIHEIVSAQFADDVLRHCVEDASCFLLFYSNAQPDRARLLREWTRLAQLCTLQFVPVEDARPVHICTFNLDDNELPQRMLGEVMAAQLLPAARPAFVLLPVGSIAQAVGEDKLAALSGYTLRGSPRHLNLPASERHFASFIRFLCSEVPGFEAHARKALAQYWRKQLVDAHLQAIRSCLLNYHESAINAPQNAPRNSSADSPKRALSLWLASDEAQSMVKTFKLQDAPHGDSPEALVSAALFSEEEAGESWAWVLEKQLNELMKDVAEQLRDHMPPSPFHFVGAWLLMQPIRLDALAAPVYPLQEQARPASAMSHSEIVRRWPVVRRCVVGAPSLARTTTLIDEELTPLINRGLPIDAAPYGYTLLYLACAQGNVAVAKFALRHGANLQYFSKDGALPIEAASATGQDAIIDMLLQTEALLGAGLHYASAMGQHAVVSRLLHAQADVNASLTQRGTQGSHTPLSLALEHGQVPMVKLLLEGGARREKLPEPLQKSALLPVIGMREDDDKALTITQQEQAASHVALQSLADIINKLSVDELVAAVAAARDCNGGEERPSGRLSAPAGRASNRRDSIEDDEEGDGGASLPGSEESDDGTVSSDAGGDSARGGSQRRRLTVGSESSLPGDASEEAELEESEEESEEEESEEEESEEEESDGEDESHRCSIAESDESDNDRWSDGAAREPGAAETEILIDGKAIRPDATDGMGWTMLMHAATKDDAETATKLLVLGAQTTKRNRYGLSMLLWAHWHEARRVLKAIRKFRGNSSRLLSPKDASALERLREAFEEARGDDAATSLMRPGVFKPQRVRTSTSSSRRSRSNTTDSMPMAVSSNVGVGADATADDTSTRSRDGIREATLGRRRSAIHLFSSQSEVPVDSLEQALLRIEARHPGEYPDSGHFQGQMQAFIDSCKLAVQDTVAGGEIPSGASPTDIFALHLYTRAELFGAINRAFRDQDRSEMDKWKTVTAAARVAA